METVVTKEEEEEKYVEEVEVAQVEKEIAQVSDNEQPVQQQEKVSKKTFFSSLILKYDKLECLSLAKPTNIIKLILI